MKEHLEFITKITENPYYPVKVKDYDQLFDFKITSNGIIYLTRLQKQWNQDSELSATECLYLGMLHLAFAMYKKSPDECKKWQAYMFLIGRAIDLERPEIKNTLKQMGCIEDNPKYNPKLFKSHLIWKNNLFRKIEKR